jgi:LPS sulfotransferase NodH
MRPHTSYVVCATQRSGSSLLLEALARTGLAGRPEEYFLDDASGSWEGGAWARRHGVSSRADYLRLVLEQGTSPNGVFGVKLMWNYFGETVRRLREIPAYAGLDAPQLLPAIFPNVHYIHLARRDRVRQAVSWSKAAQTGSYAWHQPPAPGAAPVFDFEQLDNMIELIAEAEAGWARFFEAAGVRPFTVVYEDLVAAYESTALAILKFLGIAIPADLVLAERTLRKQSDEMNEKWVRRYLEMKQRTEGAAT